MENSGKILFQDKAASWYIALESRWIGPLSAADVYEKIQRQEITWAHYAWKRGQSDWKRICDIRAFTVAVPHHPGKSLKKQLGKETQSSLSKKIQPSRSLLNSMSRLSLAILKFGTCTIMTPNMGRFLPKKFGSF